MNRALLLLTTLALAACQTTANTPENRARLALSYPNLPVQDVRQSPVKNLLEVYSEGRIVYYAPQENLLLLGDLFDTQGALLSREQYTAWLGERAAMLDVSKAASVGAGPQELIAFVDPDCAHCREAVRWLETKSYAHLRVHFFFLSLDPKSAAYTRALQVACAPEALRREAVRQAFGISAPGGPALRCAEGEQLLAAQSEIVKNLGVTETPVFVARGQTVRGFYPDRLDALLWSSPLLQTQGVSP